MAITVAIATHNQVALLERTLRSLGDCDLPDSFGRTMVVENGGRHGAEKVCNLASPRLNVSYYYNHTAGKSLALNTILEEAGDDFLLFLDDDVRLSKGVLTAYSAAASEYNNSFFGGPTDVDYEEQPLPWLKLPPSATGWSLPDGVTSIDRPKFLGFNWGAWAKDLRDAGGFDEKFGPGSNTKARGQESSMQRRLLDRGMTGVYIPDALVWHYVPKDRCSVRWSWDRAYQNGVAHGLNLCPGPAPRWMGYPRWLIRQVFQTYCIGVWSSLVKSHQASYESWWEFHRRYGVMVGARIAFQDGTCSDEGTSGMDECNP